MSEIALRERDIARLWEGGHLPPAAIVALDGTPLQVVYRGRPNSGAGPDFRDAIIALPDGRLLHGDVELHLLASDFRRHGHDRDPAYGQVILHLVYRADTGAETSLFGGRRARVVSLERWLSARAAELAEMLVRPALWREPCNAAVERMGSDAVAETLARLGERRLREKAAALKGLPPAVALYEGLVRTLGQGVQRPAWVALSRRLPVALLGHAGKTPSLEALFLGAAGLLPTASDQSGAYLDEAWQRWRSKGVARGPAIPTTGSARPSNHPARRLAGLARLLTNGPDDLLVQLQASLLVEPRPERALLSLLTVPSDGLWRQRLLPWGPPTAAPGPALIGAGKSLELAINAALPALMAKAERDGPRLMNGAVTRVFHALAAPGRYGRTAHLVRALRSDTGSLIRGADRSQGALHLYANYCTRGGCGRCPLS